MQASALAFAAVVAEAMSSCDTPLCAVDVADTAGGFQAVIVTVTQTAVVAGCSDETGILDLAELSSMIVSMSVEAIASLLVEVRPHTLCPAVPRTHHAAVPQHSFVRVQFLCARSDV